MSASACGPFPIHKTSKKFAIWRCRLTNRHRAPPDPPLFSEGALHNAPIYRTINSHPPQSAAPLPTVISPVVQPTIIMPFTVFIPSLPLPVSPGLSLSARHSRLPLRRRPCLRTDALPRRPLVRACAPPPCPAAPTPDDWPLGPPGSPARLAPRFWFKGLGDDVRRRAPLYLRDWTDGLRLKSIPAVLYLYFACLAPVVAFGGITSVLTAGSMGVVEFLLSSGATGMLYAVMSGQPLTFIAPTGLTLAFTCALYGFCQVAAVPFLSTYAWVGVWASLILFVASITNFSDLIKYCTRFTDDVFNSLIATNFIYEAGRALIGAFFVVGADKTNPFTALSLALGTFALGRFLTGLRSSRYLVKRARTVLADFGPVLAIAIMSAVAAIPAVAKVGLERLSIPTNFTLAGGRSLLVPLLATPVPVRLAAIVPALLLTCLFFLDQNISVRVVNSPLHRLQKGPGYHLDMLVLAICTFVCSIFGLPLMCAGTVQSLAHVQALAQVESQNGKETIVSVQENRLTAFLIHAGILGSLFLLPIVKRIPMAVISGLFLFLGRNMMNGNDFLSRIPYMGMDPTLYPEDSPMRKSGVPARQVHAFTLLQLGCLASLWALKLNKKTSMFFPAVIATLMFIRSRMAPRLFPAGTLDALDGEIFDATDVSNEVHSQDHKLSTAN
ncbi:probable anion transporter [Chondrus crispus]|uniref:Probable anion transporter n=1 Tax=Chondrus crispus TaxID=2769 RepID=R7QII1_CHOCR|nr:probable anion transporter [Chondrus crispus]CDF37543.1 probable anion transporter [Chondrus crispus]|eukprot:XP_005717414.1 probable anion transporter [Chondrus crispus]